MMITYTLNKDDVCLAISQYLKNQGYIRQAINPELISINVETIYEERGSLSYPGFKSATIEIPDAYIDKYTNK